MKHLEDSDSENEDIIMNISSQLKKKKNKKKRKHPSENADGSDGKKQVKFSLEHSQTRGNFISNFKLIFVNIEFFMHGKVATQKLPNSSGRASPSRAAIKAKSALKKANK